MQEVGTVLAVVLVRFAEEFCLQLRGCKNYKCCKLDIVSCIHFLTYCFNIVREFVLASTCIRVKYIVIFFFLRHYTS